MAFSTLFSGPPAIVSLVLTPVTYSDGTAQIGLDVLLWHSQIARKLSWPLCSNVLSHLGQNHG